MFMYCEMTTKVFAIFMCTVALVESASVPLPDNKNSCDENGVSHVWQSASTEGVFCCSDGADPAWLEHGKNGPTFGFMISSIVERSPRVTDDDPLWKTCGKDQEGNYQSVLRLSQAKAKHGTMIYKMKCAKVNIQQEPGRNMTCRDMSTGKYNGTIHVAPDGLVDEVHSHMETAMPAHSSPDEIQTLNEERNNKTDDNHNNIILPMKNISVETDDTSDIRPEEPKGRSLIVWTDCFNGQRARYEICLDANQCNHGQTINKTFHACGSETGDQVGEDAAAGSVSLKMGLLKFLAICIGCLTLVACFYFGTKLGIFILRSRYVRRRAPLENVNNNNTLENRALVVTQPVQVPTQA